MAEYREDWSVATHERKYVVKLEGATVQVARSASLVDTIPVARVEVTWRWKTGEDPADLGPFLVALRTATRWGSLNGGTLYPSQLREVPKWLESIIDRSQPR